MDKKIKSRWVPPTMVQKSKTTRSMTNQNTAPRWVPPTTARVNQANSAVTSTSANTSTGRSNTTHETKASHSHRRINLPSTSTCPPLPFGDNGINGSLNRSSPSDARSTVYESKATERELNLPITITYLPHI